MTRIVDSKACVALLAAAAVSFSSAAIAHHSFAMYDNYKETVVDGVVREFQWTNPHGWVQLTVAEDGKDVEYSIELSSINVLARAGWNRKSLKPGDRVKVTIHPLKDGSKGGSFMKIVKADGTVLGPTAPP